MNNNLLIRIKTKQKTNKDFELLINNIGFLPANREISSIPSTFIEKDGNFKKQFQTTEFNQRLWELQLFKTFQESGFINVNSNHEYPDFELEKDGIKLFVEAVSTNPTNNDSFSKLLIEGLKNSFIESIKAFFSEQILDQYSLKLSNSLYSKLQKKYWTNSWVEGCPLIIAINAFHNPYTSMIPDAKIIEYLYNKKLQININSKGNLISQYSLVKDIVFDNRKKPSGFFSLKDSENISAVIFNNERPLWKFNRMGFIESDKVIPT